ncbi:MAG: hypothetical protein ACXVSF_06460 [Solirubrobacteraceae bacterium]
MRRVEGSAATTQVEPPIDPAEGGSGAQDASQTPAPGGEQPGDRDETGRFMSREAATYRRRLRETESERDSLREQLDRVQRAEVERLAGAAGLAVASDVWQFGATLDTLRNAEGDVDGEIVAGLVADIVRDRPGLQAAPVGDIGIGKGNAASGAPRQTVGLSALLKP